ncbi:unnamed protein product [Rotaria socialis]|uniref:Secreted protein n=1 Tax=Rotaria socialis TaxID=392032 RepID=A0A821GA71_9BILA|nr:unnamed protein product [Rotaria socialis]CAF4665754.1 unnamed protein product [Rotaria socialis]
MKYLVNLFCISLLSLAIFADDSQINSILPVLNDDNGNAISTDNVIGSSQIFSYHENYESSNAEGVAEDDENDFLNDNDDDDEEDESDLYKNDDVDSNE